MNTRAMFCLTLSVLLVGCALLSACLEEGEPDHPLPFGSTLVSMTSAVGAGVTAPPNHLPCEIERLLHSRCKSCHSPMSPLHVTSLLTRAELVQPSKSAPGITYAQQAQLLIQSGMMPPTSSLLPADIQLFSAWVQAGAPAVECGAPLVDAGHDASN